MVTVFREPAARLVSEFYQVAYNRRVITSWDWCANPVPPLDLSAFLASPPHLPFQSRVTKLLAGSPVQTGAAGARWGADSARARARAGAGFAAGSCRRQCRGQASSVPAHNRNKLKRQMDIQSHIRGK